MNKRIRKTHKSHSTNVGDHGSARTSTEFGRKSSIGTRGRGRGTEDLVVVATASTVDEAKETETLLKNNEIPAMVKDRVVTKNMNFLLVYFKRKLYIFCNKS